MSPQKTANFGPGAIHFDKETELYYLSTRYYSPNLGRFLNADAFTSTGQGLLGNNMFTYCLNNPVMYSDDTGNRPVWESNLGGVTVYSDTGTGIDTETSGVRNITDAVTTYVVFIISTTGNIFVGAIMNNVINAIYYNYISDGESGLETTCVNLPYEYLKSDYVNGYINRWDRLDYTKKTMRKTAQSENYDTNAWRFQSEYALHMHLWNVVEPFQEKGIWIADRIGKSAKHAHVDPFAPDPDWKIKVMTTIIGILGL